MSDAIFEQFIGNFGEATHHVDVSLSMVDRRAADCRLSFSNIDIDQSLDDGLDSHHRSRHTPDPHDMTTLERALSIAALAHEGQVDKAGVPYILHPLRVMLRLRTPEERIVAVLHDVVEDTSVTMEQLRAAGFSEPVLEALDAVTKRPGEDYERFVLRAAAHPIGRRVKLADLAENSDLSRIPQPTRRDHERIEKYRRAIETLEAIERSDGARPDSSA